MLKLLECAYLQVSNAHRFDALDSCGYALHGGHQWDFRVHGGGADIVAIVACTGRASRRVENPVDLAVENLIHDGLFAVLGLRDLGSNLALDTVAAQHLRGAGGSDDVVAHVGQALDREDQGALVAVGHGYEDGALRGRHGKGSDFALGIGRTKVGSQAHDLTGGLHLWREQRIEQAAIGAAEAVEWQDCFLDGNRVLEWQRTTVIFGRNHAFGAQIRDARAHHDARGCLSQWYAGGLGDKRHGAGSTWVGLNDVEDVILQGELDIHQALDANALSEQAGGGANLFNVLWSKGHRRQSTGRVTRVDAGFLDVLHDAAQVDFVAVAQGINVNLDGGV